MIIYNIAPEMIKTISGIIISSHLNKNKKHITHKHSDLLTMNFETCNRWTKNHYISL